MEIKQIRFFIFLWIVIFQFSCQSSVYLHDQKSTVKREGKTNENFYWGINGHPLTPSYKGYDNQYLKFSYEEQINFLKQLNLQIYRVDVHTKEDGIWNEKPEEFETLLNLLQKNNIEMLPVIFTNPWREGQVKIGDDWDYLKVKEIVQNGGNVDSVKEWDIWESYYDLAYTSGEFFSKKYGDRLKYYQIGNEIAYYIIKNYPLIETGLGSENSLKENVNYFFENFGGDDLLDFFHSEEHAKRVIASAAYVSGFIDSIKENDIDGLTVINGTRIDYGYIELLNLFNVKYDIVGWNWYSDFGDIADVDNSLGINVYEELRIISGGKPIWLTEANRTLGSYFGELSQTENLEKMIKQIYQLPNVQSFIVYELIDRDYENPNFAENYFGLLKSPFQFPKENLKKPSFDTYRYTIEELQYGNEDFENAVFQDLFTQEKIDFVLEEVYTEWVNSTDRESTLKKLILSSDLMDIEFPEGKISKEQINEMTTAQFQRFLKRTPLKRELRFWQRQLKRNPDLNQMVLEIMLSEEYWENAVWAGYEKRTGFMRPQLPR